MRDEHLEVLSDEVRKGHPVTFIEALRVIEYQETLKEERLSWPWWKRVWYKIWEG